MSSKRQKALNVTKTNKRSPQDTRTSAKRLALADKNNQPCENDDTENAPPLLATPPPSQGRTSTPEEGTSSTSDASEVENGSSHDEAEHQHHHHHQQQQPLQQLQVKHIDDSRFYFCVAEKESDTNKLKEGVRQFIYLENAFPTNEECELECVKLCRKIKGWDDDDKRRVIVSKETSKIFMNTVSSTRSSLQTSMKRALLAFEFDPENLPPPCKMRSKKQYRYLVDGARFARAGHRADGGLLQNEVLGRLIHIVFHNTKAGPCRLKAKNDVVSRNTITLTYCLTLYAMVSAYPFKVPDPRMNDTFRRQDGYWLWLYKRTMQGKGNGDECIDWQAVHQVQSSIIDNLSDQGNDGAPESKLLYQAAIKDGEYVSSDENE